jgi:hypothetical protein
MIANLFGLSVCGNVALTILVGIARFVSFAFRGHYINTIFRYRFIVTIRTYVGTSSSPRAFCCIVEPVAGRVLRCTNCISLLDCFRSHAL